MTNIRFYAADLAAYNNGVLHGVWIDADTDVDVMQDEINAMLRKSPYPNVTVPDYEATARAAGWSDDRNAAMPTHKNDVGYWVKPGKYDSDGELTGYDNAELVCVGEGLTALQVPSAEEWAMHDMEGLPKFFGEYSGLSAVADYMELAEEQGSIDSEDLRAIVDDYGSVEDAKSALEDNFCGIYESFKDYAEETADEQMACYGKTKEVEWLTRYFDYDAFARDLKMDMHTIELPSGDVAVFHA